MTTICNHERFRRTDKNFISCIDCSTSWIKPLKELQNKKQSDFVREDQTFNKHFTRNFNNKFESETDWNEKYMSTIEEQNKERSKIQPVVFRSENGTVEIVIDKNIQLESVPIKYKTVINGEMSFQTEADLRQYLHKLKAFRIK